MTQIEARILQQDYLLTCPEGQEEILLSAVSRVDADMERIRNTGKVRARERVGVLAAVNLAFENLALQERTQVLEEELELALEAQSAPVPDETVSVAESAAPESIAPETEMLMAELQSLLSLREQELLQAQALIQRLEAALEIDSKLL